MSWWHSAAFWSQIDSPDGAHGDRRDAQGENYSVLRPSSALHGWFRMLPPPGVTPFWEDTERVVLPAGDPLPDLLPGLYGPICNPCDFFVGVVSLPVKSKFIQPLLLENPNQSIQHASQDALCSLVVPRHGVQLSVILGCSRHAGYTHSIAGKSGLYLAGVMRFPGLCSLLRNPEDVDSMARDALHVKD